MVRTLVPVSVRPRNDGEVAAGDGTMANKVSAMFAELPVMLDDPGEALAAVSEQMADLKESKQAVAGEALTSMADFAPPMLLALGERVAARAAQRNVNTVTTNVPGPELPLYSLGRRMLEILPVRAAGRSGARRKAMFSYHGTVCWWSPATTTPATTSACSATASRRAWRTCCTWLGPPPEERSELPGRARERSVAERTPGTGRSAGRMPSWIFRRRTSSSLPTELERRPKT